MDKWTFAWGFQSLNQQDLLRNHKSVRLRVGQSLHLSNMAFQGRLPMDTSFIGSHDLTTAYIRITGSWFPNISNKFLHHSFELPRIFQSTGKFLVHGLSTGLLNSTPIEVVANVQNIGGGPEKKQQQNLKNVKALNEASADRLKIGISKYQRPASHFKTGPLRAALALKALATKICGLSSTPETWNVCSTSWFSARNPFIGFIGREKTRKKPYESPTLDSADGFLGGGTWNIAALWNAGWLSTCVETLHQLFVTALLLHRTGWKTHFLSVFTRPASFVKSKKLSLRSTKYFVHFFWGTQLHGVSLVPSTAGENAWSRTFAPVIGDNIGTSFVGIQRAIHATPIANGKNVHLLLT